MNPTTLYEVSISAYSLSLVPRIPVGKHAVLYGKAGVSVFDVRAQDVAVEMTDRGLSYGLGVEYAISGPLDLRFGYDILSSDVKGPSLSIIYSPN